MTTINEHTIDTPTRHRSAFRRVLTTPVAIVISALMVATFVISTAEGASAATAPAISCRSNAYVGEATTSLLGGKLTFEETQPFCWTGKNVYSIAQPNINAQVNQFMSLAGWNYKGVTTNNSWCEAGYGMTRYICYRYIQGKFEANQLGFQFDTWSPWLEVAVYYNGAAYCAGNARPSWSAC